MKLVERIGKATKENPLIKLWMPDMTGGRKLCEQRGVMGHVAGCYLGWTMT